MKLRKPIREDRVELYECYANEPYSTSQLYADYVAPNAVGSGMGYFDDSMAEAFLDFTIGNLYRAITKPLDKE